MMHSLIYPVLCTRPGALHSAQRGVVFRKNRKVNARILLGAARLRDLQTNSQVF
jgi:hypothetical protein